MDVGLVYDVGAHIGHDTEHYLSLGYRVVAIEADPVLVRDLNQKFAPEIAGKRLTLLNLAIAEQDGKLTMGICPQLRQWNTFDIDDLRRRVAKQQGFEVLEQEVPCRRFQGVLAEHGVPFFLKSDIEGYDHLCVLALSREAMPQYVSFEAYSEHRQLSLEAVLHLYELGYRRFSLVNQDTFESTSVPEPGQHAHLKWSAKQFARRYVRARPGLQRTVQRVRELMSVQDKRTVTVNNGPLEKQTGFSVYSSGPTPIDRKNGWQDMEEFLFTWTSLVRSGEFTSSWFDIHAAVP